MLDGVIRDVLVNLDDADGALDLDVDAAADHQAGESGAVDEYDAGGYGVRVLLRADLSLARLVRSGPGLDALEDLLQVGC